MSGPPKQMHESIFEPPAPPPASPQPPALQQSLFSLVNNDDAIEEVLKQGDLRMLSQLKGVSWSWRAHARRVLCARLCRREGQPLPTSPANVTDIDVEPCLKAIGPGVTHMIEAMTRFPNHHASQTITSPV